MSEADFSEPVGEPQIPQDAEILRFSYARDKTEDAIDPAIENAWYEVRLDTFSAIATFAVYSASQQQSMEDTAAWCEQNRWLGTPNDEVTVDNMSSRPITPENPRYNNEAYGQPVHPTDLRYR